ncbi:GGDEF domain-containing protein [Moritella sp. 36]|uniref:GGDEF domain-containing protein n=1 Tax=Moritella sp. 36 TaxID=2746233 RepID=UPI001BAAC836|nr:GGDEF domain-containing protein [Moritella sp. 36]QUM88807.1 GGDEF domain-containing protein [Moritella sp. 36]
MTAHTWLSYKLFNLSFTHPLLLNMLIKSKVAERAYVNLASKLQSSLDPEVLLAIFKQSVREYIPLCHLEFHTGRHILTAEISAPDNVNLRLDLFNNDYVFGQLECDLEQRLTMVQQALLTQLSKVLSNPLYNALEYQKMKLLAFKDSLTGLANRNKFEHCFQQLSENSHKKQLDLSLLIIDLDGFKWVNDKYGHQTGDLVLANFAQLLLKFSSERVQIFRFAGDEFTILINGVDKHFISCFAQGIQNAVTINHSLSEFNLSCSIGSAEFQCEDTLDTLFARADKALYRAKAKGRNRAELAAGTELCM